MPPSSPLKKLLPLTIASLLLTAGSASAAAPDAPWAGAGTATTTITDNGSATNEPTLKYDANASKGKWEFSATAKSARQQPIEWTYEGFHSWAGVTVSIESFVVHSGHETVKKLKSDGPVWCCTAPSGGFKYTGTATLDLQPGDTYGFRMAGSHGDWANKLMGALRLKIADVTPPTVTPTITGTMGPNGYYTSDVNVAWKIQDVDGPAKKVACDDATVTADTAGTTYSCTAESAGGTTKESVTIKRDTTAPALKVPAALLIENAGPSGAIVDYDVTATDSVDAKPSLTCTPASGAVFPLGVNTVACTSTDAAGNGSTESFGVVVVRAAATPAPAITPTVAPAPKQINPLLALRFSVKGNYTKLNRMIVKNLPHGTTVTISCKTKCPKGLSGRTFAQKMPFSSIDLSRLLKGKPLKAGTVFNVVATTADGTSATKTITLRKGKAPLIA